MRLGVVLRRGTEETASGFELSASASDLDLGN